MRQIIIGFSKMDLEIRIVKNELSNKERYAFNQYENIIIKSPRLKKNIKLTYKT